MTLNTALQIDLLEEADTTAVAQQFALQLVEEPMMAQGMMVYLEGDLGAGKSFFCRALIQTLLPGQRVKSPTYTLLESYETSVATLLHFDLYRLCDAEELEFLGVRDLLTPPYLALVEWPSKGEGYLEKADVLLQFKVDAHGRKLSISAQNMRAQYFVNKLTKKIGMELDNKASKQ
ncbi:tRNA (adenosine(37)-N6)-threonylcarbamoyltransferase complex ATPase subunit type 1 TsaE [Hydrogenovibrio sp. SC-1]|uniref:tRNA (adenosine(37)-N6)-threonylcarbamoyltransferase complex ATPase subunit type 1 TsaE n=1 Tax=Hydrogenovibrio sp. SC-1 TaxID=2065820 RepID=UPI000C7DAA51|nr:tRNA (adenosine(37)-N6)-threonylcarbamoyltransferase complex ATPase subunit type 1 TsaE [Hydrogenovibrio sp. SC-1]PLA74903.1 tRNA (adenosine(37)-N6)-threonylcarbamoyltransferase complex ATPase subunit type 1 TsaE [Hydrogenovibrio sp. SC-1]